MFDVIESYIFKVYHDEDEEEREARRFLRLLNDTRCSSRSLYKVNYQIYPKVVCITCDRPCNDEIIAGVCASNQTSHEELKNEQIDQFNEDHLVGDSKHNISIEQYLVDWFVTVESVVIIFYMSSLIMMLWAAILILLTCRNKRNYIHLNLFMAFGLRGAIELVSWFTNDDLAIKSRNINCGSRVAIHYAMIFTRILVQSWLTIETWVITRILRQFNPWHTMSLRRVVFVGYMCPFVVATVYGLVRYLVEADQCWTAPPKFSFWFWYIPAQCYSWLTTVYFFQVFCRLVCYNVSAFNCGNEEGTARPMTRSMNQNVFEIMCASSWVGFHQMISDLGPPLKRKSFKPWLAKIYIDRSFEGLQGWSWF